jgi:hypothetical protein
MVQSLSSHTVRKTHESGPPLFDVNSIGRLPCAGDDKTESAGLSKSVVNGWEADLSDEVTIGFVSILFARDERGTAKDP